MKRRYKLTAEDFNDRDFLSSIGCTLKRYDLAGVDLETKKNGLITQHSVLLNNYQIDVARTPVWRPRTLLRRAQWVLEEDEFERYEVRITENMRSVRVLVSPDVGHGFVIDSQDKKPRVLTTHYAVAYHNAAMATDRGYYPTHPHDGRPDDMAAYQKEHLFWSSKCLFNTLDKEAARRGDAAGDKEKFATYEYGNLPLEEMRVRILHGVIARLDELNGISR